MKIPVIAVGRLEIPELAEETLESGKSDLVALGRGLLTDPFWVKKVEEGNPEKIRPCIGCHDGCMGRIMSGRPISCAINPTAGRERRYAVEKAGQPKKAIIIRGGPAGLEAARTAPIRGHLVTLYEKKKVLGGWLNPGSVPAFKKDIRNLLEWYESDLGNLGVEIKLESEGTSGILEEVKADVVLIATGSQPIIPDMPGLRNKMAATAPEILLGMKQPREKSVIIGGGLVGCETAIWLALQGKKVTIIEILRDLMIGIPSVIHMRRMMLLDMLQFWRVKILTETRISEINDDRVFLMSSSQRKERLKADTVVRAVGLEPDKRLYETLLTKRANIYLVGDAREARNITGAIWDAYEVARRL